MEALPSEELKELLDRCQELLSKVRPVENADGDWIRNIRSGSLWIHHNQVRRMTRITSLDPSRPLLFLHRDRGENYFGTGGGPEALRRLRRMMVLEDLANA